MRTKPLHRLFAILTLVLSLFLMGCSKDFVKREPPPSVKPLPPRVDCNQPSAADPPPHPTLADTEAWTKWAVMAYLTIGQERELDRIEEACIQTLKTEGIIR